MLGLTTLGFFFHFIPGLPENFTRIALGAALFSSPEDPKLEKLVGLFLLIFLVAAALRVRRIRTGRQAAPFASLA